jgi:hypothetical protein
MDGTKQTFSHRIISPRCAADALKLLVVHTSGITSFFGGKSLYKEVSDFRLIVNSIANQPECGVPWVP